MIYLITGRPGAGKTSNTLAFLAREAGLKASLFGLRKSQGLFFGRQVLVNHVDGLRSDLFGVIGDDAIVTADIPPGAVILIDEAHRLFPVRPAGSVVPAHVRYWAEHRHHGVDLYIITQSPGDLDMAMRSRVDTHVHYVKPFGLSVMSYTWSGICDRPDSKSERKDAIKQRVKVDKAVFDLYTSTTNDTTQRRVPALLYWLPVLALGVIAAGWFGVSSVIGDKKPPPPPAVTLGGASQGVAVVSVKPSGVASALDPLALTYSGSITSGGVTSRYYSLATSNGQAVPLTGEELAQFGVAVVVVGGLPSVAMPDGSYHIIPPPVPVRAVALGGASKSEPLVPAITDGVERSMTQ